MAKSTPQIGARYIGRTRQTRAPHRPWPAITKVRKQKVKPSGPPDLRACTVPVRMHVGAPPRHSATHTVDTSAAWCNAK